MDRSTCQLPPLFRLGRSIEPQDIKQLDGQPVTPSTQKDDSSFFRFRHPSCSLHQGGNTTIRTLIVDDDRTFCQFLATVLTGQGIDVTWTTDGLATTTLARQQPYDLFILDVRMPQVLGTDLAAGLKQDYPRAQIILLSAFADAALQHTAAQLGVALLSKPFSARRLTDMITQLFGPQV